MNPYDVGTKKLAGYLYLYVAESNSGFNATDNMAYNYPMRQLAYLIFS